jgi:hypothetical protein
MRKLTQEEIDLALDDNGETSEGCVAVEATIGELALANIGTSCGHIGNTTFIALGVMFPDNDTRLVRGWLDSRDNTMCGMIHIQCHDEDLAERISNTAYEAGGGGSLRPDGPSLWEGFWEFESE